MRTRVAYRVARLESAEILRDPQVGWTLGALVGIVHLLVMTSGPAQTGGGVFVIVAFGPLGLLFLAGPRRGSANEVAFGRLVLTTPVSAGEWFWGRVVGLHALTLLYMLLVLPAFALEAHAAGANTRDVANAGVGFLAYAALVVFLGLAMSGQAASRGPVRIALIAFAFLVSYRFTGILRTLDAQPLGAFLLALVPTVPIMLAAGLAPASAPPWALAGAIGALVGGAGWLAWTREVPEQRMRHVWVAGPLVAAAIVALTLAPASGGAGDLARSGGRSGWLGLAWLLSLAPMALAAARGVTAARSRVHRRS